MKITQNQFHGKLKDVTPIPEGSTFLDTDTGKMYYSSGVGYEQISSDIKITNTETNKTVGISVDIDKESSAGTGWGSQVKTIEAFAKGNSTDRIAEIVGVQTAGVHTGSGQSYFIVGVSTEAIHAGSGNTGGMYGVNSKAIIQGDGEGSHSYVIGENVSSRLNNPNATVQYLQGMHLSVNVSDGEVTDNVMALILDFDNSGGTISGDFEYLRIQNDTFSSTVGGTARAINCKSVLPSEFGGSIQAAGLINSAVTEHADNAAAVAAGLAIGTHYRTGDLLKIVH